MFATLGRWCFRHRGKVALLWLAVLIAGGALSGMIGTAYSSEFALPDVESRRGFDILDEHFADSSAGGEGGTIVFRAEQGVDDPEVQQAMTAYFEEISQIEGITVVSPYSEEGAQQIAAQGPEAGTIAYAQIGLPRDVTLEEATEIGTQIRESMPEIQGVQIEIGGALLAEFEVPSSELLGLAFAIIVLILAFGSVLAMGLPIGIALAGIGVGTILAGLLSHVLSIPDFATTVAVMLGLGVGIDYALFIVTRYRENLHKGASVEEATVVALDTAGRAVAFAATTVVISLLGMLLMGLSFITGLAGAAAVVVAVTAVASLTLLPALLGFAGERVEVTRWRGLIAALLVAVGLAGVALAFPPLALVGLALAAVVLVASFAVAPLRREVPRRRQRPLQETVPYRWSRVIQRHPVVAALAGVVILLVLAIPFFSLRMAFSDEGNYPEETTTRQAYDLLALGFGPGFNGPMLLATEVPEGTTPAALEGVTEALAADPGVAFVTPAVANDPAQPTAALWRLFPTTAPQDEATTDLVERLRAVVLPAAEQGSELDVAVSGGVAASVDFSEYLTERMPLFIGVVLLAVVRAADAGVPVAARAAEGGDHEPAVDRRRVRRGHRGLPVGMVRQHPQHRARADRAVRADDDVRDRVRAVDGLRGVPAVAHPRGVPAHGGQPALGRRRPRGHGPRDHGSRRHHGRRLRQLHRRERPHREAVRRRSRERRAARCHDRAHAARAGHDGAAGRRQLVAAEVARPSTAEGGGGR